MFESESAAQITHETLSHVDLNSLYSFIKLHNLRYFCSIQKLQKQKRKELVLHSPLPPENDKMKKIKVVCVFLYSNKNSRLAASLLQYA